MKAIFILILSFLNFVALLKALAINNTNMAIITFTVLCASLIYGFYKLVESQKKF